MRTKGWTDGWRGRITTEPGGAKEAKDRRMRAGNSIFTLCPDRSEGTQHLTVKLKITKKAYLTTDNRFHQRAQALGPKGSPHQRHPEAKYGVCAALPSHSTGSLPHICVSCLSKLILPRRAPPLRCLSRSSARTAPSLLISRPRARELISARATCHLLSPSDVDKHELSAAVPVCGRSPENLGFIPPARCHLIPLRPERSEPRLLMMLI